MLLEHTYMYIHSYSIFWYGIAHKYQCCSAVLNALTPTQYNNLNRQRVKKIISFFSHIHKYTFKLLSEFLLQSVHFQLFDLNNFDRLKEIVKSNRLFFLHNKSTFFFHFLIFYFFIWRKTKEK